MAEISQPPKKKPNKKGSAPQPDDRKVNRKGDAPQLEDNKSNNLNKAVSTNTVQMKFDVLPEFKQEYQIFAIQNGMSMKELFETAFNHYKNGR